MGTRNILILVAILMVVTAMFGGCAPAAPTAAPTPKPSATPTKAPAATTPAPPATTSGAESFSGFKTFGFAFYGGPFEVRTKTLSGTDTTEVLNTSATVGDSNISLTWSGASFNGQQKGTSYAIVTETAVSGSVSPDGKTILTLTVNQTMDKPINNGSEKTVTKLVMANVPISKVYGGYQANIQGAAVPKMIQSFDQVLDNKSGTMGYTRTVTCFKTTDGFKISLDFKP